ncbi:hypothetical protein ENSA5_59950 [Enhygromyxa salina]|uniref:Uncharacterized protein n=1 Tax=Enhygromyxa salina TaxID=215803 RepID=A0A2S9XDT2_9BACT|nr:hypothetical protein [Enhygromyxa salina]PRP90920.1 hypothetical protein ENSA5_59950 [Enhygromyxa salina]
MTEGQTRRAARAQRRAQRQAERDRRRAERAVARLVPGTRAPDVDPGTTIVTAPNEELRRRRTFKLLERAHMELVCSREAVALQLFGAAPGTDEHEALARRVEAFNDEIDDLRGLSDELLRQVHPLALDGDRLVELEGTLASARVVADASQRADALLGVAEQVLGAFDDALDGLDAPS